MYYPMVGERVRIVNLSHEFIVLHVDHDASTAILSGVYVDGPERRVVPFRELIAKKTPLRDPSTLSYPEVVRSTNVSSGLANEMIRDMRETLRSTAQVIKKSRAMLKESQDAIDRWKTLDCHNPDRNHSG